ncbi:arginine biosynthesis protein ArgJ [Colletotrichum falcatum]|nr:arginine biosynthesis protein ArgJ [Colletotrichum falcatum]
MVTLIRSVTVTALWPPRRGVHVVRQQLRRFSNKFELYENAPIPANKRRFVPDSGFYPKGFSVASINAGINSTKRTRPDLTMVKSDVPSCGAAVFTRNKFPAASVTASRKHLSATKGNGLGGVIANAGCANLFTGQAGLDDAAAMMNAANELLVSSSPSSAAVAVGETPPSVIVMHTGKGGERLPMDKVLQSIRHLPERMGNSHQHWLGAAEAICTTDTFPKLASRQFELPSNPGIVYSMAGITKGAGMIHPNMATTLGIICTDAPILASDLQALLADATDKTYNCISIEGDTSTNDMVAILANGAAGGKTIGGHDAAERSTEAAAAAARDDFRAFKQGLDELMTEMAKLVVRDAEGATKFITIRVRGAWSPARARRVAAAVARSVLVKTGVTAGDLKNWGGTVLAAVGSSLLDVPGPRDHELGDGPDPEALRVDESRAIIPERVSLSVLPVGRLADTERPVVVLRRGMPVDVDASAAMALLEHEDVEVLIDMDDVDSDDDKYGMTSHKQKYEAVYWTSNLTQDFVAVNGG